MADFCKQCHEAHAFPGENDLKGVCDPGMMVSALCEGCGSTFVDSDGSCISKNCLRKHGGVVTLCKTCEHPRCDKSIELDPDNPQQRIRCRVHWNARITTRRRGP